MKAKGKREARKREGGGNPIAGYGKGVAAGILALMFVLLLCAGLMSGGMIQEQWLDVCVLLSGLFGGLAGALMTFKGTGKRGVGFGAVLGAVLAVILGVSGVLLYRELDGAMCGVMGCSCIVGGGMGGWLYGKKSKRRR